MVRCHQFFRSLLTGLLKIHFSALDFKIKILIYTSNTDSYRYRFLIYCLPRKIEFLETLLINRDNFQPAEWLHLSQI